MGGRGATSSTGRALGKASASLFGKRVSSFLRGGLDKEIYGDGEKSIEKFAKKEAIKYAAERGQNLPNGNGTVALGISSVARNTYSAIDNLNYATQKLGLYVKKKGTMEKSKLYNDYLSRAKNAIDSAKNQQKYAKNALDDLKKTGVSSKTLFRLSQANSNAMDYTINSMQKVYNQHLKDFEASTKR